jgi:hypothetical protein
VQRFADVLRGARLCELAAARAAFLDAALARLDERGESAPAVIHDLDITGDRALGAAFSVAFPGP